MWFRKWIVLHKDYITLGYFFNYNTTTECWCWALKVNYQGKVHYKSKFKQMKIKYLKTFFFNLMITFRVKYSDIWYHFSLSLEEFFCRGNHICNLTRLLFWNMSVLLLKNTCMLCNLCCCYFWKFEYFPSPLDRGYQVITWYNWVKSPVSVLVSETSLIL